MNVPILMKILNKLTSDPLQGRCWKRLNTHYVDRLVPDPVLRRRLQVEFQPEVQRLAELPGRDLNSWSSL